MLEHTKILATIQILATIHSQAAANNANNTDFSARLI